jgi:hypothetical protein
MNVLLSGTIFKQKERGYEDTRGLRYRKLGVWRGGTGMCERELFCVRLHHAGTRRVLVEDKLVLWLGIPQRG